METIRAGGSGGCFGDTYRLASNAVAFRQQNQQFELVGGQRGNTSGAHMPLAFKAKMTTQWR